MTPDVLGGFSAGRRSGAEGRESFFLFLENRMSVFSDVARAEAEGVANKRQIKPDVTLAMGKGRRESFTLETKDTCPIHEKKSARSPFLLPEEEGK